MPRTIARTLNVKKISYEARGGVVGADLDRLDGILRAISARTQTVGQRHYPPPDKISAGKFCVVIDGISDLAEQGVTFVVYTYTHGLTPDQLVPNLEEQTVTVVADPIETHDGEPAFVTAKYSVHVLGEIMIAESVNGTGGFGALLPALQFLAKKYCDRRISAMRANNVPSRELVDEIRTHGGVVSATVTLEGEITAPPNGSFAETLETTRRKLRSTRKITTTWSAQTAIEAEDVVQLWEEAGVENGWGKVSLRFADKSSKSDIDSYCERKTVHVQAVREGVPATTEVHEELRSYMRDLMDPMSEMRILSTEGMLLPI